MIIFINGSFGVGKTSVAKQLVDVLPNALIYDPEEVGLMLRNILKPVDWSGDFQDYPLWRTLLIDVAKLLKDQYKRTLIMPMTIWRSDYFKEVMSGLTDVDADIHHFCLTASTDIIRLRLIERGEQKPGDWVFDQISDCVTSFQLPLFEKRIDTSNRSPEWVVQHIKAKVLGTSAPLKS